MGDSTSSKIRRRVALVWALRIVLGVFFLYQGIDKFSASRLWLRVFDAIGFGQWFRYFTGVVEITGGLMLLIPSTVLVGVALLVCTMIGALLVHVFVFGASPQTALIGVLLVLLYITGSTAIRRSVA